MHAASPFCRGPGRGFFAGYFHMAKKIKNPRKKVLTGEGRKCYYIQALARSGRGRTLKTIQRREGRTTVNSEMSFDLEGWETRTPD